MFRDCISQRLRQDLSEGKAKVSAGGGGGQPSWSKYKGDRWQESWRKQNVRRADNFGTY